MIKELYRIFKHEVCLNVTQGAVDSVRIKNIVKSGARVYDGGYIGIAGTIGEPSDELFNAAEKNLAKKIEYKFEPEKNKVRKRDARKADYTDKEVVEFGEKLLAVMTEKHPQFVFSNKIKWIETNYSLKNDAGLDYEDTDAYYVVSIIYKHRDSVAVFDGGVSAMGREFDVEKIAATFDDELCAFEKPAELSEGEKVPVVVGFGEVGGKILEALNGKQLGHGASLFADKMGQKAFSDNFTLGTDLEQSVGDIFFDTEGSTLPGDKFDFIENGVIKCGYADKKTADTFGMQNTACAGGGYDDVPTLGAPNLAPQRSDKTIKELLHGQKAVYVGMMSGGDTTNEGEFASPVQLAYLVEDGRITGKLPEFGLSGNIFDVFGKDFVGVPKDEFSIGAQSVICNMKVSR